MKSSSMEQIRSKSRLTPLRITLIYFFIGAFWIFTSDKLLSILVHSENTLLYLETSKGWFYVLVTACMLYVLIQRSFSTIKRGQEALQKSEKRFRDLVEYSLTGISLVQDNNVIYQNQEQEQILGPLPRSYLFGDFKGIHPDDVEKVKLKFQEIISGKSRRIRMDFRCYPPGRMESEIDMKWVYCLAILTEYEGKDAILFNIMDMTKAKELEHLLAIQDKMASLRKSGIKLQMSLAENLSLCKVDHNLIEETVLNLINNAAQAMKPMEEGKQINVTSASEHNRIIVRISDSGPGVPKDIRDKIFDPFFSTKSDSTGIGLSLCHRIIDDHGGSLTVSDSDLGGAEFRIEIPIKY